jgi:hypothetical protein
MPRHAVHLEDDLAGIEKNALRFVDHESVVMVVIGFPPSASRACAISQ